MGGGARTERSGGEEVGGPLELALQTGGLLLGNGRLADSERAQQPGIGERFVDAVDAGGGL